MIWQFLLCFKPITISHMCTIDGNGNCNDNMAIDEEGGQENPLCTFQSIGKLAADLLHGELRRRGKR